MTAISTTLVALCLLSAQGVKGSQHFVGKLGNYKDHKVVATSSGNDNSDFNANPYANKPETYHFVPEESYEQPHARHLVDLDQPAQFDQYSKQFQADQNGNQNLGDGDRYFEPAGTGDAASDLRNFGASVALDEADEELDAEERSSENLHPQEYAENVNGDDLNTAAVGGSTESGVYNGTFWKVRDGDICNLKSFPLPGRIPSQYFECLKPTDDDINWPWQDIGIWHRQNCTYKGYIFSPTDRVCKRAKSVRRSQQHPPTAVALPLSYAVAVDPCAPFGCYPTRSYHDDVVMDQYLDELFHPSKHPRAYPAAPYPDHGGYGPGPDHYEGGPVEEYGPGPGPIGDYGPPPCDGYDCPHGYEQPVIPRPCPLAKDSYGAQPGGICSWMLDPLATFSGSRYYYLQCTPYPPGIYCGRWLKRPCAHGTRFDVTVQVCVHDENATPKPYGFEHEHPHPGPYVASSAVAAASVQAGAAAKSKAVARRPHQSCTSGTVPIAECNSESQCPGYSTCQVSIQMCCQPALLPGTVARR